MSLTIHEVTDKRMVDQFINFPFELYHNNPYWAPPVKREENSFLVNAPSKVPELETIMYIVKGNNGKILGRIQVIINHKERTVSKKKSARFYKFDFINDVQVCRLLLDKAEDWVLGKGIDLIKGPFGYSNLDSAGFLIKGFDKLSNSAAIYNYSYYVDLIRSCGYKTYLEWVEIIFQLDESVPKKIEKFSKLIKSKFDLKTASFTTPLQRKKRTRQIFDLINICYTHLPGFVPLSDELKAYYNGKYRPLINKNYLSLIVDQYDNLIGFGLTIPSYTKALQKANGSLLPFGFYHLWKSSRTNDRAEMLLIAIHPSYQGKGVNAIIMEDIYKKYLSSGVKTVESTPMQENNTNALNLWKEFEYKPHKSRVCLYKELGGITRRLPLTTNRPHVI